MITGWDTGERGKRRRSSYSSSSTAMTPGNESDRGWVLEGMTEDVLWITPPDDPDPATSKRSAQLHETTTATWRPAPCGARDRRAGPDPPWSHRDRGQELQGPSVGAQPHVSGRRVDRPGTRPPSRGPTRATKACRSSCPAGGTPSASSSFAPEETIEGGEDVVVVAHRWARNDITGLQISDKIAQVFTFNEEDVRPRPGVLRPRRGAQSC